MGRRRKKTRETQSHAPPPPAAPIPPAPEQEIERFEGIARALGDDGPLLGTVTLAVAGQPPKVAVGAPRFELELPSGRRLGVDGAALAGPVASEALVEKGDWSALEGSTLARPFRASAPVPHVGVKLTGCCVMPGDLVLVVGVVTETEGVADGVYREIERVPTLVRAEAVVIGEGAAARYEAWLRDCEDAASKARLEDERRHANAAMPRAPTFPSPHGLWGLLLLVAYAPVWMRWRQPGAAGLLSGLTCVCGFLAMAIVLGGTRRPSPFLPTKGSFEGTASPSLGAGNIVFIMNLTLTGSFAGMGLLLAMVELVRDDVSTSNIRAAATFMVGSLFVFALVHFATWRRHARLVSALLDAPPLDRALRGGAWGSVEGFIRDRTPVRSALGLAAIALEADIEHVPGSNPDIRKERIEEQNGFAIESPLTPEPLQIDLAGGLWATTVTLTRTLQKTERDPARSTELQVIPVGARALAAGRVLHASGPPRLRAGGAESLLIFATSPADDPRLVLTHWRRGRSLAAFGVLVLAMVLGDATVSLWSELPPVPGSSE